MFPDDLPRFHDFHQTLSERGEEREPRTPTGRKKSNPNLQNIPIPRTAIGNEIRRIMKTWTGVTYEK